ncbi:glycerol kinase GlpK [soil metagenome]
MDPLILAIDAGTTGITVLVVNGAGEPVARAYQELPQIFPRPGWVEHDPLQIWDAVTRAVARAAAQVDRRAVQAIGITNQRETTVLWERKTLRPVANAIVWQDRRSAGICSELKEAGLQDQVRSATGLVLDPYFCGSKLTWLMRQQPELRRRSEAGELAFGTVDSWLVAKLTGGTVHATDVTNACRTLLFNISTMSWDPALLELFGVAESLLPEVRPCCTRFGMADEQLLGFAVPIAGIAGDQQAALFGQACFEPGMSKNTYGTGSFVMTNTGSERSISKHGLLTTVALQMDEKVTYALEGTIFITGAAVSWLRDGLGIIGSAAETEPLALTVPDSGGTYFVPSMVGLAAPHWDPDARGAITGISRGTTKGHVARATVEAMAFQTRDVVDAMVADSGISIAEIRVDGGASVMDLLCQFQADLLGVPVARPTNTETTAMGAAYLAGITAGVWAGTDEVSERWKLDRRFEPSHRSEEMADRYRGWLKAVESVRTTRPL